MVKKTSAAVVLKKGATVAPKVNPAFRGVVTRAADDGQSGYVHFNDDVDPDAETHFHCSELELAEDIP